MSPAGSPVCNFFARRVQVWIILHFTVPLISFSGKGEENSTGKYVRRFGGTKVLLHYGGGSAIRSGLLDRVKASLTAEGIAFTELGGVRPNPRKRPGL